MTGDGAGARLVAAYEGRLRDGTLGADAEQRAILNRFAQLADALCAASAPGPLRRWLAAVLPGQLPLAAPRGIYLWGSVGRGKTWLMDLFHGELPLAARQRLHFHHFMRDVHQRLATLQRREAPLDIVAGQIAADARVLCLDELQVSDIGDAMILHGLFAALLQRGVCLVITSNQPPAELYAGGLQRERFLPTIQLLQDRLEVLQLSGGVDYRLRHLSAASTYLVGDAANAGLQTLFSRLAASDHALTAGGALHIEGRDIPVVRAGSGIAWFTFAALCTGPRSPNDYIEIARLLHTVLVADVPVMDELQDDAARRFIALVDELYDHNVKLVIAAAAEPQALYRGERLKFAFERTTSRLIEMRSHAYLAREHRAAA
ncbi:MAG: cell division protein ZapE [Pseudomonadota bacterium]